MVLPKIWTKAAIPLLLRLLAAVLILTVAILTTVIGKIEYGLFYRRSTKLGSGYLLTVLIMDLMFTSLYVTVIHALSEQYSRTDMYSLKQ